MDETPFISVEHLTAAYGDRVIVKDISFTVARGEVFVILGGSGCGKSTVLKHMIGLYTPAEGRVLIDGDDITAAVGEDLTRILRRIGVSYQSGALFGSMNLMENVRLPIEEYTDLPTHAADMVALTKLKLVGLAEFCHHMPSEISGGMQKRAAIARAMALDPAIIFLDEPSAGLDPITSADLDQLILTLAKTLSMTFVIVSHELASVNTIADRVIMLDKSTKGIIATGQPKDLAENSPNPIVKRFFNRLPEQAEA